MKTPLSEMASQYVSAWRDVPVAPQTPFRHDADGGMTQFASWTYAYDSANRHLDANGNTVAQYTYDAFGNTISQSGSLAHSFRHRFSTKCIDSETGLYYYGHRFYSPVLRRWLTRDPAEENGGLNLYGFCGNNATMCVDSLGNAVWNVSFCIRGVTNGTPLKATSLFYNPLHEKGKWTSCPDRQ